MFIPSPISNINFYSYITSFLTPVPAAFADIKARLKQPALEAMDSARPLDRDFLDRWKDPEVRLLVGAAVERLKGKS